MLASQQPSLTSLRRDAWVEVDLACLESNVRVIRSWLKSGTKLMAVVKSDAYGHGAPGVAPVLAASGADWFGVASVDEGRQLRAAGIKSPILILGPCPFWTLSAALEADLQLTVTSIAQINDIHKAAAQAGKPAGVHVKIDTGMHRLGLSPDKLPELLSSIYEKKSLKLVGLFSHLSRAEDSATTAKQLSVFQGAIVGVPASPSPPEVLHLASGEAARRFPETHFDLVRVGLYLYGLEPTMVSDVVSPTLSVKARINHLQDIAEGEAVGYGLTWTAKRASRLASIPIGYADGVDRRLSNQISGLLMGKVVSQVGLISMDQMLFDITDVPQAQESDIITLIGTEGTSSASSEPPSPKPQRLHLATWATLLGTITYELACRLRVRLPRIYTRSKSSSAKLEH